MGLLGIIAGLTRAVPIIGPLLGALPLTLVCFVTTRSVPTTGLLLLGFTLMHFLESKVLLPQVIGHEVDLHPVTVILALLIGMTAVILFVPATLGGAAQGQASAGMRAGYLIGSTGPGVPAAAVRDLRAVPGVRAVVEDLQTTIWVGEDKRSALASLRPGCPRCSTPG